MNQRGCGSGSGPCLVALQLPGPGVGIGRQARNPQQLCRAQVTKIVDPDPETDRKDSAPIVFDGCWSLMSSDWCPHVPAILELHKKVPKLEK